jgi:chemotaxis protein methyltransferase CheR
MTEHLSSSSLAQFSEFVTEHMGFYFPPERRLDLERGMRSISRAFEFDDMESCVQWLVSSPVTQSRIEILASHLTVGETYFFRERPSLDLLEARVLPELIERRRNSGRRLRLWSAGCCTGEEAYSIAILLKRLLPDLADWQITILATDINPNFLKKAEDGVYGEWSFRGVPAGLKEKYFAKRHNGRFEILPEIKKMVTFSYLNLMEETYPSLLSNTNAMDIIFCRNVLMYFGSERAKEVVRKLRLSLLDGGWLIVSPCETSHVLYEQFTTVNFPGAILYQKDNHSSEISAFSFAAQTHSPLEAVPSFSLSVTPEPAIDTVEPQEEAIALEIIEIKEASQDETAYGKSLLLYEQGCYEEAARILSTLLERDPSDGKAASLLARVYANQGNLAEASRAAEQAVAVDKLNPSYHVLQATILQEQGAVLEATRALQRAVYLEPNFVFAHFALGNLARRQDKVREADRHFDNARTLLSGYSREQVLPEFDGMTAGRLLEIIRTTADIAAVTARDQPPTKTMAFPTHKPATKIVKEALR